MPRELRVGSRDTVDVAVVGYGPVGQTMAALLGRYGHHVAVFDRHAGLYQLPRVGGWTTRSCASCKCSESPTSSRPVPTR